MDQIWETHLNMPMWIQIERRIVPKREEVYEGKRIYWEVIQGIL